MNYSYYVDNYTSLPFFYWAHLQATPIYQNDSQKLSQPNQIPHQEHTIKIQNASQNKEIFEVSKSPKPTKKPTKKKSKSRRIKKRDMSFSGKSQKENRNYTSIVCRKFLFYLAEHYQLKNIINTIIQHFKLSLTFETFFKTFRQTFDLKKSYIRKQLFESVCTSTNCQEDFSLIFRVLFRRFLKMEIFPTVFKSTKLTKKVKSKEAKYGKEVYDMFFSRPKQENSSKNIYIDSSSKKILQNEKQNLKVQNEQIECKLKKQGCKMEEKKQ